MGTALGVAVGDLVGKTVGVAVGALLGATAHVLGMIAVPASKKSKDRIELPQGKPVEKIYVCDEN